MLCSEPITVGKIFVILTMVSCCKGLAMKSGIQLQQAVGRKQQTKQTLCTTKLRTL